tara:strand:+ start:158 stop:760 length:603 start_codon:yes stop_codon:yes gene_type:complete
MSIKLDFQFPNNEEVDYTNYYYFDRAFDAQEIASIHKLADAHEYQVARTGDDDESNDGVRKSRIKWLPKNEKSRWLYEKIGGMAIEANQQMYKFDLTNMREELQYTEYPKDSGHYDWHMDIGGSGIMTQRKLSCTIELSEHGKDYDGGLLQANLGQGIMEMPQGAGTAVFFPSFFVHRVTPVTRGERRSLVLWIGGDHYK